jgi:hypothetical protein
LTFQKIAAEIDRALQSCPQAADSSTNFVTRENRTSPSFFLAAEIPVGNLGGGTDNLSDDSVDEIGRYRSDGDNFCRNRR